MKIAIIIITPIPTIFPSFSSVKSRFLILYQAIKYQRPPSNAGTGNRFMTVKVSEIIPVINRSCSGPAKIPCARIPKIPTGPATDPLAAPISAPALFTPVKIPNNPANKFPTKPTKPPVSSRQIAALTIPTSGALQVARIVGASLRGAHTQNALCGIFCGV